mmetsp:Transcript_26424/g.29445  ORF Transcript_26424/g.29445 Transcript_26424/m.29445 type:complete len:368 (-) Transcript_26424:2198-3301(-)
MLQQFPNLHTGTVVKIKCMEKTNDPFFGVQPLKAALWRSPDQMCPPITPMRTTNNTQRKRVQTNSNSRSKLIQPHTKLLSRPALFSPIEDTSITTPDFTLTRSCDGRQDAGFSFGVRLNSSAVNSSQPPLTIGHTFNGKPVKSVQPMITIDTRSSHSKPKPKPKLLRSSSDLEPAVLSSFDPTQCVSMEECEQKEQQILSGLDKIRDKIEKLKQNVKNHNKYIAPDLLSGRKSKKLKPSTYELLFNTVCGHPEFRGMYLKRTHPSPKNLGDLAGMMYFLLVNKSTKRPPQVGFQFRSYSDSHYTSVNRMDPMICKVKQWQSSEPGKQWRLYHFYRGNKSTGKRRRSVKDTTKQKQKKRKITKSTKTM